MVAERSFVVAGPTSDRSVAEQRTPEVRAEADLRDAMAPAVGARRINRRLLDAPRGANNQQHTEDATHGEHTHRSVSIPPQETLTQRPVA